MTTEIIGLRPPVTTEELSRVASSSGTRQVDEMITLLSIDELLIIKGIEPEQIDAINRRFRKLNPHRNYGQAEGDKL